MSVTIYYFLCVGVLNLTHCVWPFLLYEAGRRQREMAAESSWTGESFDLNKKITLVLALVNVCNNSTALPFYMLIKQLILTLTLILPDVTMMMTMMLSSCLWSHFIANQRTQLEQSFTAFFMGHNQINILSDSVRIRDTNLCGTDERM